VPTKRPRHLITETDQIARALDDAAERWPQERQNRARLLIRLVEEGHRALASADQRQVRRRREAVSRTSGALTGLYGRGYLEDLRRDWPP
jgi:hypothetical protein